MKNPTTAHQQSQTATVRREARKLARKWEANR